jgi:hypothetical protein
MVRPRFSSPERPAARAPQRDMERGRRAAEQQRSIERQRSREQQRATEQQTRERNRAAQEQRRAGEQQRAAERQRQSEQRRAAEQQRAQERQQERQPGFRSPRAAERPDQRPDQAERRGAEGRPAAREARRAEMREARAKLSADQRASLRRAFPVNRDRISKVRFARHIGTRIPRSVRLFAVPAAVYAIFPYYQDYRYVVVDDAICIVDPDTYEVVDILDDGFDAPGLRPQVAELRLTERERQVVLDAIPPDFPEAQLRLRLALGAEVPGSVELYEFAPIVLDRVPKLRDFRFVVAQDQVVIVEPRDRSIALFLDR